MDNCSCSNSVSTVVKNVAVVYVRMVVDVEKETITRRFVILGHAGFVASQVGESAGQPRNELPLK